MNRYLTVSQAAEALGLPGKTRGARAQLLRRLEARGILPPAKRSSLSHERYYTEGDIPWLRSQLSSANSRATASTVPRSASAR